MKRLFLTAAAFFCVLVSFAREDGMNCFGIVVGKDASIDGSVIFGHNEDDGGEQMLNMYSVPADPAKGTVRYLWAEFPGMTASDAFMNGYGVCVASDNCMSREDRSDLSEGGVLYQVRVEVGSKARSARDGVRLLGEIVEKYGYSGSGRSYIIADPSEAWICSIVKGRRWVAQRVPDDKVMTIPNYYVIAEVDMNDTANFKGSPDLIDYAVERGWYKPETDGKFNFRKVYHNESTFARTSNIVRHKLVLSYLAGGDISYDVNEVRPMTAPCRKIGVLDVMNMLSLHQASEGNSHPAGVCTDATVASTVFHLRSWLPREVGCVMWCCPGKPCAELYVPWHLGLETTPREWRRYDTVQEALENHFKDADGKQARWPEAAIWHYVDRWKEIASDYERAIAVRSRVKDRYQQKLLDAEARFVRRASGMKPERIPARELEFTRKCLKTSLK